MSASSCGSASAHLFQMLLIALAAAAWSNASDDAQGIDVDTETFHRKGDDAKRPFGGGSFSRGRSYDGRWVGQASLTPWPMSKYVNRHDSKRHNRERPAQPREEPDDWSSQRYPVDKRPFGPGVFSRPSAHRTVKRPFGGGVIFSRPREDGKSRSNYRRYGYSRERRESQFQSSPNYRSSDLSAFGDDGYLRPNDVSRAWLKIEDVLQRSRPLYNNGRESKMNDYGDDDEYNLEFAEDEDDEDDEDNSESQPGARKLEISDNPFEEKRKAA